MGVDRGGLLPLLAVNALLRLSLQLVATRLQRTVLGLRHTQVVVEGRLRTGRRVVVVIGGEVVVAAGLQHWLQDRLVRQARHCR